MFKIIIKSFLIAFSMYSKIPVPKFEWKETDMKYTFCFFPWIGVLIGVLVYLCDYICGIYNIGVLCRTALLMAVPILVTGGFHIDGFMDTMDALHSYAPREKKLEILKDPHIGAFAVIMLALYGLIFAGALSEVENDALLRIVCCGFVLSRCLCGISALTFPLAKKEGMLNFCVENSGKKAAVAALCMQGAACVGIMCLWSSTAGMIIAAAAGLSLIYYRRLCKEKFGGISGDTSGYFVLICEGCIVAAAAFINIFMYGLV